MRINWTNTKNMKKGYYCPKLSQWSARSSFDFQDRVRDSYSFSLNIKTESKTGFFWVSMSRPSQRLDFLESQFWDRVRDWNYPILNLETKSKTKEMDETKTKTESLAILRTKWHLESFRSGPTIKCAMKTGPDHTLLIFVYLIFCAIFIGANIWLWCYLSSSRGYYCF